MKVLILIAMLVAVAACGAQSPASFTEARMAAVNDVNEAIAGAFPSGTYLEEMPSQDLSCTDTADKPTGEFMAGAFFRVHVVDDSKSNQYFDRLKGWWADHNWSVATDSRPNDKFMNASRNGYLMSVQVGADDRMTIGNTAPCTKGKGQ